jgi:hypothetical protein
MDEEVVLVDEAVPHEGRGEVGPAQGQAPAGL